MKSLFFSGYFLLVSVTLVVETRYHHSTFVKMITGRHKQITHMNGASPLSVSQMDAANKAVRLLSTSTRARPDSMTIEPSSTTNNAKILSVLEKMAQRLTTNETRVDTQDRSIDDIRERVGKQEDVLVKIRSDSSYAQLLLENLAATVEKEKGLVSEHTEQLRYFANQSRQQQRSEGSSRSLYYVAVTWLYTPFLLLVKGLWLVFQPLVMTMRSLSLFNSDVLREQQLQPGDQSEEDDVLDEDDDDCVGGVPSSAKTRRLPVRSAGSVMSTSSGGSGTSSTSLLTMLRQGALDPNQKKKR